MKRLPLSAKLYLILIDLSAATVLVFAGFQIQNEPMLWISILVTGVAVATLDLFPIKIFGGFIEMTISNTVKFAAVLLFPPAPAIFASFLGTLIGEVPVKRIWYKKLFNISEMTLTWAAVAGVYYFIRDPRVDFLNSIQNITALILAGLTDFGVNSVLVSTAISLATGLPFRYIWSQNYPRVILHDLSMVPLGTFLAILWRFNPISIPLAALPLLVVRHAYQVANQLQRQTRDALIAMMKVIDERDQHTGDHSEKVSFYARITAEALKLDQEEIEVVAQAALLHDLGKVGMRNDILFSPNLLNVEERQSAEKHAEIGGVLLAKFPLFERGAGLVRHHHERYDGGGYPDKLKGEEIPIGARIISVADSFQAMTEDRPYRRAMNQEIAVQRLRDSSGTQFDPRVVDAFVGALPRDNAPA